MPMSLHSTNPGLSILSIFQTQQIQKFLATTFSINLTFDITLITAFQFFSELPSHFPSGTMSIVVIQPLPRNVVRAEEHWAPKAG